MTIAEKLLRAKTDIDEVHEAGYNAGVAAQPTPTISVSSDGIITATAGTKSAKKKLSTKATTLVTPTTTNQVAVAKNVFTTGEITVAGDANLIADSIKGGVSIFGVEGTLGEITIAATSIPELMFNNNSQLPVSVIALSCTTIGAGAFNLCESLKSITLSNKLTNIGVRAFFGCSALTTINFQGTMAEWNSITKGSGAFTGISPSVICSDGTITL